MAGTQLQIAFGTFSPRHALVGHFNSVIHRIAHDMRQRVLVQDEATSVVWGMPGFVARAGLAEKILPLDQIGAEIIRPATLQPVLHIAH
jgi:CheB methylesterase